MDVNSGIRKMMEASGTSARELSRRIGRSPNYVSTTLCVNGDHKAELLIEMASAMGYKLVLEGPGERIQLDIEQRPTDSEAKKAKD